MSSHILIDANNNGLFTENGDNRIENWFMSNGSGIFYHFGLFLLSMNDDEDMTVIQTDDDRCQLERKILGELDEDITKIEMQEGSR